MHILFLGSIEILSAKPSVSAGSAWSLIMKTDIPSNELLLVPLRGSARFDASKKGASRT